MLSRAVLALTVGGLMLAPSFAQAPRQQYSKWEYNAEKKYHYSKFEYKADPKAATYTHQYVLYYKDDPKLKNWVYYYNPATEKVWARYPTVEHPTYGKDVKAGKEMWSILPKEKQAKSVYDIPAEAYPAPSAKVCPTIPECKDGCQIALPPKDLP
jgi:hypothetical protein